MGLVFLAEDTALHQQVCLKTLHTQWMGNPEASRRFTREIVLARRVAHHGVCRVHDLHDEGGLRFLTMEYVEGTPLRELVGKDAEPVAVVRALRITRNVCRALAAAHDVGVIHRDLKPRNIMLRSERTATEPDDICLLDFGIATAEDAVSQGLTQPGFMLGTRHYIAPEVWGGAAATARSDLFAVGVLLFNLLVARMPWSAGPASGQLLDRMMTGPAAPPSSLRREIPPEVDALVARALEVDPAARFADAHAFAAACDAVLTRLSVAQPFSIPAPVTGIFSRDTVVSGRALDSDPSSSSSSSSSSSASVAAGPSVDDVGAEGSASWVVGGRAVDLPARPRQMPGRARSETEIVLREVTVSDADDALAKRPTRRVWAAPIALSLVGIAAAWWLFRPDDAAPPPAQTEPAPTTSATSAALSPAAPRDPSSSTSSLPPPPPPSSPPPSPVAPPLVADPVVTLVPLAPTPAEPSSPPKPSPRVRNAGKAAALLAQRDLRSAMETRGLIAGDDAALDRLSRGAAVQLRKGRSAAAVAGFDDAIARTAAVRVDKAFVQRKLTRFNAGFDAVADEGLRARLDDVAGRASLEFAAGRYDGANRALNAGFRLLNKDR